MYVTTVLDLLTKAKTACEATTEAELAACLKVTPSALCNWRNGRAYPDEVSCARLSELTGEPLARVLGIVGEARARTADAKKVWRRLRESAAALILGVLCYSPTGTALARATAPQASFFAATVYYVRRWLSRVFSLARLDARLIA